MKKLDVAEITFGACALGMAIAWLVAFTGIKLGGWQPHENSELILNLEITTFALLVLFAAERLIHDLKSIRKKR